MEARQSVHCCFNSRNWWSSVPVNVLELFFLPSIFPIILLISSFWKSWIDPVLLSFLSYFLSFLFCFSFWKCSSDFLSSSSQLQKKKNYHFYFNIEPFLICSLFLLFIASVLFPWISCIRMPLTLLKALIFYACIFSMLFFFCFTCYTLVSPALAYWLLALFCLLLSVRH